MPRATIEIREGAVTRRERRLHRAGAEDGGGGTPGRSVRLHFPIDPEAFFVRESAGRGEAA